MQNPDSYQDSLTQAEDACAARVFAVLDLQPGRTGVVGIANGLPDSAVFDIGELGDGATMGFNAVGHYFTGSLVMYNRDRHVLQTWIMRLVEAFPVNADYSADDQLREDTNVCVLRIRPVAGAVSKITRSEIVGSNTGSVPTWTCTVLFDVVFVASETAPVDGSEEAPPEGGGDAGGGQGSGCAGQEGGFTGGDDGDLPNVAPENPPEGGFTGGSDADLPI